VRVLAYRPMVAVVIPALDPPESFVALVRTISGDPGIARIVVVDDGSGPAAAPVFARVAAIAHTEVLVHPRNLGKGAALKTAFAHVVRRHPDVSTIVTADADGQHRPEDIRHVVEKALVSPAALVLGVRRIGAGAPLRSRLGNALTRRLFALLVGQPLADTQTGLRAIPRALLPALGAVSGTAYEYELNVLVHCRQAGVRTVEVPIATVYEPGNRTSHFRPLRDSLRIYSVLFRFAAVSLGSAVVDNAVFVAALAAGQGPATATVVARLVSMGVNYPLVKRWVFSQSVRDLPTLGPYVLLVAVNMLAVRAATSAWQEWAGLSTIAAKVATETLFFLPNFLLQRDVVFRGAGPAAGAATDWNAYYAAVPITARVTRRYTGRRLVAALRTAAAVAGPLRTVAELGGAASCFVDRVCRALNPERYVVVDTNRLGLSKLETWTPPAGTATALDLVPDDVRHMAVRDPVDTVFSVGLIEHFPPSGTRDVLAAHFALVRPGGAVVVSYPTPTWLYVATRRLLEALRLWRFPDERPLQFDEVARAVEGQGTVVHRQVLWPLLLTQEMVVFVKR